jgi:site-specific DNA-adenine methylase
VSWLLHEYSEPGAVVLDPMCGGGTTAIEAVSSGRESLNFDINPVSRLVAEALATPGDPAALIEFANELQASHEPAAAPPALRDYYSEEAYGLLSTGLVLARSAAEKALILSVARQASFANTKKINTVVDETKTPKPAAKLLAAALERFIRGFSEFASTSPSRALVEESQAHELPVADETADFVLLHPPYLTNTAFSESMHLQLVLLGVEPKELRELELAYRGSYFHVPNGLKKYLLKWARIVGEAARVVRSGGHVAVVVGDGRIESIRIPVGTVTAEFARDAGLHAVGRWLHLLNNQTGMTLSRRMTGQHVLVFVKP